MVGIATSLGCAQLLPLRSVILAAIAIKDQLYNFYIYNMRTESKSYILLLKHRIVLILLCQREILKNIIFYVASFIPINSLAIRVTDTLIPLSL